jgi:sugar phosphate isomerase/epimerase
MRLKGDFGEVPLAMAIACNAGPYAYLFGRPIQIAPQVRLEGGLDVFGLRSMRIENLPFYAWRCLWSGKLVDHPDVFYESDLDAFALFSDEPFERHVDGEPLPPARSGHFSLDMLENEPDKVLDIARTVGMKAIYCPHIAADQRPTDAEGWREFGRRLAKAGKPYVDAGFIYGWHNHDFEFKALPDGSTPQERIFEAAPDLGWEADIAWVVRGGADPIEWIRRYGDRITAVHVKDIAQPGEKQDEDGWEDVGHGTVPWKAILAELENTPAKFFIMEHDKPNDHVRFAKRSIEAAKNL